MSNRTAYILVALQWILLAGILYWGSLQNP